MHWIRCLVRRASLRIRGVTMTAPFQSDEDRAAWAAAIVDSSDDAIVSKTLDGIITSWNRAAERIFGWTAAEAVGRPISIVIPPEGLSEEEDVLARLRQGEKLEHFETVRMRKDGSRFEVSLTVSPIRNVRGEIIGASKIARDITERRRADEARARLAAIVDSSDDAIVSKTLDGVVTSWNRAAEAMFGWKAAEAVGQRITLIIPRERWPEEDDVLARIVKGETLDHFDTVRVRKGGERIDVSLTVSPLRDSRGRVIGASKIARDVSERKRADAERGALLRSEQRAREEAEELNRSKDQFLAVLSHELRTPLNAIFGWARMLQSAGIDASTTRRAIEAILRNATAQVQLVEDLLDVSRIITGKMRLDVQPLDLKSVIESALDAVNPAAAAKGLKIETILDPDAGPVVGAADRLRQVVWNLLINAIKFTPRAGRIQVQLRKVDSHVEIVVSDNGEGIRSDILPYIFRAIARRRGLTEASASDWRWSGTSSTSMAGTCGRPATARVVGLPSWSSCPWPWSARRSRRRKPQRTRRRSRCRAFASCWWTTTPTASISPP